MREIDILIIGAGQAGLSLARKIQETNLSFCLLEKNSRVGDSWRNRYDSLILFTPREYSALPGLKLNGDQDGFPTKDELADYLERYSQHFSFPILTKADVQRLSTNAEGLFSAVTSTGETILAKAVVIATGAFQQPIVPKIANEFSSEVLQLTANSYRSTNQITGHSILVVGDGATGRQIALEVSEKASVTLATGHPRKLLPDRLLGKSIFWWLKVTGLIKASSTSFIGAKIKKADAFPGKHLSLTLLEKAGIHTTAKLKNASGKKAIFVNNQSLLVDTVIWAVGYRDQTDWLQIPQAKDTNGNFLEDNGISPVPGLFYIGRHWQTSRGSSLLVGVGDDAELIAKKIKCYFKVKY